MSKEVKIAAIPAAGYVYQTMQGVNLLCDWLDSPTRYSRIRFECDEDAVAPKGLDDLVAERHDGRFDLWQVKFTPSPDKHLLDWNWLLAKPGKPGGKSRSHLRKWFDAFEAIELSRIGDVCLLTNRVPDHAMEACLAGGNYIDYTRAPDEVRGKVETELDGAANAQRFFKALEVRHSDKGFAGMEAHVTHRLRRHATADGVHALKYRAVHWSIERNQPAPDGWITLNILKETLRVVPPEPLSENFAIPLGYRVPDRDFHLALVSSIEAAPRQPIVLIGPPGRGKSTYLSKVCELLNKKGVPLIRHHYYLSATDRALDRHTSFVVEESLLAQVKNFHSNVATQGLKLPAVLEACAAHYKGQGKPFVVILDGLDHVWRNQGQDKRPLDEVFNQVLPAVENLVVVVGTQPVDDAQLPNRLLTEAPRSTWQELPAMSGDAVIQYLRKELGQGRLQMGIEGAHAEAELQAAAAELRARTNGHPLHVIYATEELVRSGRALSKWSVEQLAGDLSHDVRSYYGSLWQLLSASQKDVLRLICEFPFFWPRSAFSDIAAPVGLPPPDVTAVEHLLHSSAAGLKPFHESLVVFVRQTDDYEKRIAELTPQVEAWLSKSAPNALRVNWLWVVKARQGRPEELIGGLKRDWVMERLQEGYPTELIEGLLGEAEEHAVQRAQYADAYRLRHLKTRLLNSLSYQLIGVESARLKACTWTLAPDTSVIDEAVASRHETSTLDVAALGIALEARGDSFTAVKCAEEALRRYRGESRFTKKDRSSEAHERTLYLAKAFTALGRIGATPEMAVETVGKNSPPVVRKFLEAQVEKGNLRSMVDIAVALPDGKAKLMVCDAAVRTAMIAEAELLAWSEFPQLSCGTLIGCLAALAGKEIGIWVRPHEVDWLEGGYEERQESLASLAHDWFFSAVGLGLTKSEDDFCLLESPEFESRENVSDYLDRLGELGIDVANRWLAQEPVSFSEVYEAFNRISFPGYGRSYDLGQGASDFRRSLHAIAIDLHLLSSRLGQSPIVDIEEMRRAMNLPWFDADQFRTQYVSCCVKVLSDSAADLFIRKQLEALEAGVNEETGVRMMACLELCEMALRHNLNVFAANLCRRTWELVLGYSQRKDPLLSDVMDALEYLVPIAPDDTRRLLAEVAPQVHNVLAYTDGKGTRHVLAQADALLAKLHRAALVVKHREHTEAGDWYHAENSLQAFVTTGNSDSPLLNAVMRTGIHLDVVDSLQKAAADGDSNASHLLAEAETYIGADAGQICDPQLGNSATDWKPFPGEVKTYAVADLPRLLSDLSEHYGVRRHVLREWYQYWEAQGKGSELIAALETKLLSDECRNDDLDKLLDLAFATKLKLEGKAAAFPYVVQAQLFKGGWMGPMHIERREVTEARLKLVAEKYPRRCDEFFLKSAFCWFTDPSQNRVIPSDIMVFFLGLQGRTAEAIQLAEATVRSVQEDTRTLRLERPEWGKVLVEGKGDVA
nr:NACHT domain-containing protein [uncultured Halomonas sp.]